MYPEQREQIDQFAIELIPVEEWLRDGAQHEMDDGNFGFNMKWVYANRVGDFAGKDCGTAMCIAGSAGQFNKIENPDDSVYHYKTKYSHINRELHKLFYPSHWYSKEAGDDITPEQALQAIENFKENGDPRWWEVLGYSDEDEEATYPDDFVEYDE